jgi:hypothetical protein
MQVPGVRDINHRAVPGLSLSQPTHLHIDALWATPYTLAYACSSKFQLSHATLSPFLISTILLTQAQHGFPSSGNWAPTEHIDLSSKRPEPRPHAAPKAL